MILISSKESEVGNTLNKKRDKAYLDIYKETEFMGLGFLIDEELDVYKYQWNIGFNKETHSFGNNTYLFKSENKIDYQKLETYLIKNLKIVEEEYKDSSNEEELYSEIIKLKTYVNEFSNKELYDKIKEKIGKLIKEDL
ncbi:MAG: hypothetical protein IJN90_02065 [Bacilli bacterium]|nr:hypothetical protein [Bacilli bacterium]